MVPVCPKCDVSLVILQFRTIEVDFCEQCRGVWLDAGELGELIGSAGAGADQGEYSDQAFLRELGLESSSPPARTRCLCPRCDRPLGEVSGAGLTLDICPRHHGIWFDADELARLLEQFPSRPGARKTIDYLNELFVKPMSGDKLR